MSESDEVKVELSFAQKDDVIVVRAATSAVALTWEISKTDEGLEHADLVGRNFYTYLDQILDNLNENADD